MKRNRDNLLISIMMVVASAALFVVQILIFHRGQESAYLTVQELSFLPIQVLLVSFGLDRILSGREKRARLDKTYIIISAFFSEIGTQAIIELNGHIKNLPAYQEILQINADWNDKAFKSAAERVRTIAPKADVLQDRAGLYENLTLKKEYLVEMFNNPNLLEHDTFTNMLWAFYHMVDELQSRQGEAELPQKDVAHLNIDIERAYSLLLVEWVYYMRHLKTAFPYLFSLALRKSPFSREHGVVLR